MASTGKSMQGCFASLLRVRSALYHFAVMNDADREFPEALKVFTNKTFWDKLASAERIIRPLSNVSYELQRDENTLADVVESYRDIYGWGGFLNEYSSCELVSVVEKRWKKFEQPLMLLALFLHPVHVKLARIIDEEVPELKFFERLVGYATYYYRRYCETDDTEGLAGELHSWYRGKFVDSKIVQFNGDVGGYWSFVSDIRKQSKLAKLAAVILSIALKRIVDPTERKFMNANDTPLVIPVSLADIEESRIISLQEEPSADTADYWQDIYDVLDSDLMNDELGEIEGEQLEQGVDFDQPVFNGIDESIPDPDTTPFPPHNDKTFPQEKKLIGIRGQTFRLSTLFSTKRTFQQAPYSTVSEA
ncbi:hypothetical protein PHMEG_00030894 [Phytophthora megakarya]|uniref:Uncharacterized protein n=1 Tax=Phytophthora megakarya TaxID=4795 RepID=A0A225UZ18_9STRA|nr:hypothetical protein PHMEG_00030894 [Phytophthora megakarya]